ncbi:MAG TPA: hypothetical protein VFJ68_13590 [Casimicrobiaceae bacterium]|nr:hypothetical protein [Casimicrobiaceae bacterium]
MLRIRRWLHSNAARAFVVLLLGIQVVPLAQACPMPMLGASMAFAAGDMPVPCSGLPKEACLVAYTQADRTVAGDCPVMVGHPVASLRVAPQAFFRVASAGGATLDSSVHAGAPPRRLLYCRMLE